MTKKKTANKSTANEHAIVESSITVLKDGSVQATLEWSDGHQQPVRADLLQVQMIINEVIDRHSDGTGQCKTTERFYNDLWTEFLGRGILPPEATFTHARGLYLEVSEYLERQKKSTD